jgi:hypothetical protein
MSFVHVFIVKGDRIYQAFVHWRTVESLLKNGVDNVLPLLRSSFLDSGYVVFDCNKNIVVNGQSASSLKEIRKKDLFVIEA